MSTTPNSTQRRYLSCRGMQIHVAERAGHGPAILFLPGRCFSIRMWEKQFASPRLSHYRLLAVDLPGHGLSDNSPDHMQDYGLRGQVELIQDLVDQLSVRDYVLVGVSLGAHIALQGLPQWRGCRGVFVMIMPITKPPRFDLMYKVNELLAEAYKPQPDAADVDAYTKAMLRPQATEVPPFVAEDLLRTDTMVHAGIINTVMTDQYHDETELLREGRLPVAIVNGAEEQVFNLDYLRGLSLPVWRGEPQYIPEAGHLSAWENPERFNELLASFMRDVAPDEAPAGDRTEPPRTP